MTYSFNLNDYIRVRVKPSGWNIFDKHYFALGLDPHVYRAWHPEDADGWSRWQMWEFCNLFGPHILMGPPPPVETEIIIESTGGTT